MTYFEKYQIKRDFELGLIGEKDLPEEIINELKEQYIKEASYYYNEYYNLKRKYELLKIRDKR